MSPVSRKGAKLPIQSIVAAPPRAALLKKTAKNKSKNNIVALVLAFVFSCFFQEFRRNGNELTSLRLGVLAV
jgi:hypothetical protein